MLDSPQQFIAGAARDEDFAACLLLLREGSKSFHAASRLLPSRLRKPVHALYAFCRVADDAVDNGSAVAGVAIMRRRLSAIYHGDALSDPVDLAFAATVRRFAIPRELPEALFEGFQWDAEGRRYRTLSDVRAYAVRVAGTVGAMMALLMGVRDGEALARACDLGVAMQLTNIARDIGEDARAGRIYLPTDWFANAGIDLQSFMDSPVFDCRIARFTAQLLAEADRLYQRAEAGIARLPSDCRPAIWAARFIYHAIGTEIAGNGFDSVSTRARVTGRRKLALLARAHLVVAPRPAKIHPCLAEAAFVLIAAGRIDSPGSRTTPVRRITWLIDLFERLERNDRFRAIAGHGEVSA